MDLRRFRQAVAVAVTTLAAEMAISAKWVSRAAPPVLVTSKRMLRSLSMGAAASKHPAILLC